MYNEELKCKFIRSYTANVKTATKCEETFNITQTFEEEWGADLCTRGAEDLNPMASALLKKRWERKYWRLAMIKGYVSWCIANGVPGVTDGFFRVKYDDKKINDVEERYFGSPRDLSRHLDILFRPSSDKTIDEIYKCVYWLAYFGIEKEDVMSVRTADVDLQQLSIFYRRKNVMVPIYREAIQVVENCTNCKSFSYQHPNYKEVIQRDRIPDDYILRGVRTCASSDSKRVRLGIIMKVNEAEKNKKTRKTDLTWIYQSGIFYRMFMAEIRGIEPDFSVYIDDLMEGKEYADDYEKNRRRILNTRVIKRTYHIWKLVYGYSSENIR